MRLADAYRRLHPRTSGSDDSAIYSLEVIFSKLIWTSMRPTGSSNGRETAKTTFPRTPPTPTNPHQACPGKPQPSGQVPFARSFARPGQARRTNTPHRGDACSGASGSLGPVYPLPLTVWGRWHDCRVDIPFRETRPQLDHTPTTPSLRLNND